MGVKVNEKKKTHREGNKDIKENEENNRKKKCRQKEEIKVNEINYGDKE